MLSSERNLIATLLEFVVHSFLPPIESFTEIEILTYISELVDWSSTGGISNRTLTITCLADASHSLLTKQIIFTFATTQRVCKTACFFCSYVQ